MDVKLASQQPSPQCLHVGMHTHECLCTRVFICACMFMDTHVMSSVTLLEILGSSCKAKLKSYWFFEALLKEIFPLQCSDRTLLIFTHLNLSYSDELFNLTVLLKSRDHVLFIFI